MKFFGLEINDILVSFILTLIVSGAITYFCHMRLKNIENAVTKQNQVLSSFITNVKNEINPTFSVTGSIDSPSIDINPASLGPASLASSEAIKAVAALEDKNGLIEISDDDSDSSDGSETDGSESEEDEEDQKIIPKLLDMNLGNLYEISQDDIKIIDLICIPQQKYNSTDSINSHNSKIIEIFDVNTSDTDSDDESEDEIIVKKIVVPTILQEVEVTPVEVKLVEVQPIEATSIEATPIEEKLIEVTPIEEKLIEVTPIEAKPTEIVEILTEDLDTSFIKKIHTTHEEGETKLEKLKIEDLRHLAVTKGLGSKDEVKKIKKSELIALLEKL